MRTAYPWDATKFTPKFTGIPPHVTLMDEIEIPRCKFNASRADIKGNKQEMMDDRGVGGS